MATSGDVEEGSKSNQEVAGADDDASFKPKRTGALVAALLVVVLGAGLAAFFEITPGAVSQWGDDDLLPELRRTQLQLRRPDLFLQPDPDAGRIVPFEENP